MRRPDRKGFTLAELLIVVAILGVLVAVAIPVFTSSLAKAALTVDQANERSAIAIADNYLLHGAYPDFDGKIQTLQKGDLIDFAFQKDGTLKTAAINGAWAPDSYGSNRYEAKGEDSENGDHVKDAVLVVSISSDDDGLYCDVTWVSYK